MSDQPETIDAILAEMRDFCSGWSEDVDVTVKVGLIYGWECRLEAAAERERETADLRAIHAAEMAERESLGEWRRICAACAEGTPPERCAYYGDPNGCNAPTLGKHPEGNLAERLQEALEKAEHRIAELERAPGNADAMRDGLKQALAYCESDQKSGIAYSDNDVLVPMLRAALSAPARNCDRFQTEEEAYTAFMGLFDHFKGERHYQYCRWLFATAEGGDHA